MSLLTIQNGRAAFADGTDLGLPDWLDVTPDVPGRWQLDAFALGGGVGFHAVRGAALVEVWLAVQTVRRDLERIGALP